METPPPDFSLLYADASLLIVDKATRLLSVPGRGEEKQDCLIRRVQIPYPDALIVHRLDFDTSGLIVLARGKQMHRCLSILFQERQVEKRYTALVDGQLTPSCGEVNLPLFVDWPNRPLHRVDFENGKPSLTHYRALGDVPTGRAQLLAQPWQQWVQAAVTELTPAHPELASRLTQASVARYGHAMAIALPGMQHFLSQIGLQPFKHGRYQLLNGERARSLPTPATARLAFAHSDWSGYSVFEEAFTRGHAAGLRAL